MNQFRPDILPPAMYGNIAKIGISKNFLPGLPKNLACLSNPSFSYLPDAELMPDAGIRLSKSVIIWKLILAKYLVVT